MAIGAAATVVTLLPMFLTGALAVQLTEELAFGAVGLGVAVALHRAGAAATAPFLGRLSDHLGAARSIRIASVAAVVSSLGIAVAPGWAALAGWLTVAGASNALAQPAANRLLSNLVPLGRLGTAFGLKQSAPPIAALLAGVSVPLIGVTVGWRWAYVLVAVASLAVIFTTRPPPSRAAPRRSGRGTMPPLTGRRQLLVVTIAYAFGNLSNSAATTFYVDSAVRAGSSPAFAGTMLAIASLTAVGVRIVSGVVSDRMVSGHLRLCAVLLLAGATGCVGLAHPATWTTTAGIVVALAGTWGFQGVFWYALVRLYPDSPGRLTGAVFPGGLIGGTLGPSLFGLIADTQGRAPAWVAIGLVAVIAGVLMFAGARGLASRRPTAA